MLCLLSNQGGGGLGCLRLIYQTSYNTNVKQWKKNHTDNVYKLCMFEAILK